MKTRFQVQFQYTKFTLATVDRLPHFRWSKSRDFIGLISAFR